eukprot:872611-Alexandrium_andersonii.AAC.1
MTTPGSPCCWPRPRPGSMRLKSYRRLTAGETSVALRCSKTPCSSRDLASCERTRNTWGPGSAGRPMEGGTARHPSSGKTWETRESSLA